MKSLLPQKAHYYIYIFSIILLVTGMPLSKFLMSLSQIILICNWVLSGHLKNKFRSFFQNKAALVLSSVLIMHFVGLLYTSDYGYAYGDLRIKVPLFILPLIFSTSPALPKKITDFILHLFVGAILVASAISTLILFNVIHRNIVDIRNISIFISHIRFALLVCVSVFISIYLLRNATQQKLKMLYAAIIAWLLVFLVLMQSVTGMAALAVVAAVLIIYKICTLQNAVLKYSVLLALLCITVYSGSVVYTAFTAEQKKDVVDLTTLEPLTKQGNAYYHDTTAGSYTENGHYIWLYYCENELKEEWQKRSSMDFNWKDKKGNVLRFTLARYMTSKNLRKDAEGVKQLTDEDIRAVERGATNVNYKQESIKARLHELGWELQMYKATGDANGHSLTQRFEYWKAAKGIIAEHPLIGVGTGDIKNAFDAQYEKTNSQLKKEFRFRSHNQYLSIAVAFGIIGLLWFLITLVYPMIRLNKATDFLYITFFIVATVSFLTEDTLETQAGVNFYAFFNAFFLFVCNPRKMLY